MKFNSAGPDPEAAESSETSNDELVQSLKEIDERDDIDVTSWEADFLDTVINQWPPLSSKQRDVACLMIDQYL